MRAKKAAKNDVVEAACSLVISAFVPVVSPMSLLIVVEHALDNVAKYPLECRDVVRTALVLGVLQLEFMTLAIVSMRYRRHTMSRRLLRSVGLSEKSSKYGRKLGNVAQVRWYTLR